MDSEQKEALAKCLATGEVAVVGAHGEVPVEPTAHLIRLIEDATPTAEKAREASIATWKFYGLLAEYIVVIRRSVVLPNGRPDWFGSSEATKQATSALIDEALAFAETGESRVTVKNRLMRFTHRRLPATILDYVCETEEIDLPPDERQHLLSLGAEAQIASVARLLSPEARRAIKAVNKQYADTNKDLVSLRSPFQK
jgi:hypothetical protein